MVCSFCGNMQNLHTVENLLLLGRHGMLDQQLAFIKCKLTSSFFGSTLNLNKKYIYKLINFYELIISYRFLIYISEYIQWNCRGHTDSSRSVWSFIGRS